MASKARVDVRLENRNHLVIGISGSGKSTWVKRQVKRSPRLLVWDPDGEYDVPSYDTKSNFLDVLRACYTLNFDASNDAKGNSEDASNDAKGNFTAYSIATRYQLALCVDPTPANFEWFSKACLTVAHAGNPITVVAEEIADVTSPGKASPHWGMLCRRGRKYGVQLYAVTQRPAECDKTIYSQAAFKWLGYLDNENDHKRIGQLFGIAADKVASIKPLHFIYKRPGPQPTLKVQRLRI